MTVSMMIKFNVLEQPGPFYAWIDFLFYIEYQDMIRKLILNNVFVNTSMYFLYCDTIQFRPAVQYTDILVYHDTPLCKHTCTKKGTQCLFTLGEEFEL
jgi:hypothetical protein